MNRTCHLIVKTSDHPAERPYLVTLSDKERGVIVEHRASNLQVLHDGCYRAADF
jgi:hypothetical protein